MLSDGSWVIAFLCDSDPISRAGVPASKKHDLTVFGVIDDAAFVEFARFRPVSQQRLRKELHSV